MPEIRTEFLFTITLEVEVSNLGTTPYGSRRIGQFGAGGGQVRAGDQPQDRQALALTLPNTLVALTDEVIE
jgi:hypothetical protein